MTERHDEIERRQAQIVYAMFAQGRLGLDRDVLAVYTARGRAQARVDAQDEQLQACLVICEIELDRHPTDTYWSTPGMAAAHTPDRTTLVAMMTSIAHEAGGLIEEEAARFVSRDRIYDAAGAAPRIEFGQFRAEVDSILFQGNRDQPAEARDVAAAFHALAGMPEDAIPRDRATRDDLNERIDHLARLAAGTEYALVCGACGACGRAISRLAAYVEQSPVSHTHAPGTCGVCGRVDSVSPSDDWIGQGD